MFPDYRQFPIFFLTVNCASAETCPHKKRQTRTPAFDCFCCNLVFCMGQTGQTGQPLRGIAYSRPVYVFSNGTDGTEKLKCKILSRSSRLGF